MIKKDRLARRLRIKEKVRKKVFGTSERPRLSVYRSLKHIYAQIVDDSKGATLVTSSSLNEDVRSQLKDVKGKLEVAKLVGKAAAQKALEKKITEVVFDRGGYLYHGRVKALADGAREGGLKF
jgi:large subunit ribosomal protein L18